MKKTQSKIILLLAFSLAPAHFLFAAKQNGIGGNFKANDKKESKSFSIHLSSGNANIHTKQLDNK